MNLIERLIYISLSLLLTHIVCSLLIHNDYYNTLDTILDIDTQTVHHHRHSINQTKRPNI